MLFPFWLLFAITFFLISETSLSKFFVTGVTLFFTSAVLLITDFKKTKYSIITLVIGFLMCCSVINHSPPGKTKHEEFIAEHVFLNDESFSRYDLRNLTPEIDQAAFGIFLARFFDPIIDSESSNRIHNLTIPIYKELQEDPILSDIGSVWGRYGTEHYFAIIPKVNQKVPALVFIHGSLGNFQAYWKVLAPLAYEHKIALIFPSGHLGFWNNKDSLNLTKVFSDIPQRYPIIDQNNIHLAALSNGGKAVTRLMNHTDNKFKSIFFISAVLESNIIDNSNSHNNWQGLPVFITHGKNDKRIPMPYINKAIDTLKKKNAIVKTWTEADEDHFLMFSKKQKVIYWIISNLKT